MNITSSNLEKEFMVALKKNSNGKKILKWLEGKDVDDATSKPSHVKKIDFSIPNIASLEAAFGEVYLKILSENKFYLRYTRPGVQTLSEHTKNFKEAVGKFAATMWHVAIRGVIV